MFGQRIDDRAVHPRPHGQHHERLIDELPGRQVKGNIARPAGDVDLRILRLDLADDVENDVDAVLGGAEHFHQGVDVQARGIDLVSLGFFHDRGKYRQALLAAFGNARVVTEQRHAAPRGVGNFGEDHVDLVSLHGNRVDQPGFVAQLHGLGTDVGAGAVHRDGRVRGVLHLIDEPSHGFQFDGHIHRGTHIDVACAGLGLGAGQVFDEIRILFLDRLGYGRNGAVDFFTDDNHFQKLRCFK
ncbi:hypothetical protein DESC_480028 [Desulfosarcina cetonica]|nr:hypothetical protein DESC_480028 [Desulfosarcina cetonica]